MLGGAQWAALGNLYVEQGEFEKASFAYEELILLDPSSPQYHERVGEVCLQWHCAVLMSPSQLLMVGSAIIPWEVTPIFLKQESILLKRFACPMESD